MDTLQVQQDNLAVDLSACVDETRSKDEALALALQRLVEQIYTYMDCYMQVAADLYIYCLSPTTRIYLYIVYLR